MFCEITRDDDGACIFISFDYFQSFFEYFFTFEDANLSAGLRKGAIATGEISFAVIRHICNMIEVVNRIFSFQNKQPRVLAKCFKSIIS